MVVFEKSRGVGGRLATRRTAEGLAFDHGAQFVTARTPAFAAALDPWGAAPWQPLMAAAVPAAEPWRLGVPATNALVKPWAGEITIRHGEPLARENTAARWNRPRSTHLAWGRVSTVDGDSRHPLQATITPSTERTVLEISFHESSLAREAAGSFRY